MTWLLAATAALVAARWVLLVGGAILHVLTDTGLRHGSGAPLDVLVPAYQEARVIRATLESLLASDHPDLAVVVIDDGSTDETAEIAREVARTDPRVSVLVLPQNQGKAAALNAGLAQVRAEHVAVVDADTLVDTHTLTRLAARLEVPGVAAVAGHVKVGNRDALITRFQSIEYLTALHLERRAQAMLGCVTTAPGAASAFRASAIREVGGYSARTRTEDTDLTISLLRAGHRVAFAPEARAFTEAPATWSALLRQRVRWMSGFLQCIVVHRGAFLQPSALALFGMPNLVYSHFLVFFLGLPWLWSALGDGPIRWHQLGIGIVVYLAAEFVLSAWAYLMEADDQPGELAYVPLQRLLWPGFLYWTFAQVWTWWLRGQEVPWFRPKRTGTTRIPG